VNGIIFKVTALLNKFDFLQDPLSSTLFVEERVGEKRSEF